MLTGHLIAILEVLLFSGIGWLLFIILTFKTPFEKRKKQLHCWLFFTYVIGVISLTLFPLPKNPEDFLSAAEPHYILQPFSFIERIYLHYYPNNLWEFLKEDVVTQPFMNFLLFMPFGYFLKKWTIFSYGKIIILGFVFSLFIEVNQLTGFFGWFSQPYRLFEVDDLIMNTLGSFGGALLVFKKGLWKNFSRTVKKNN